MESLGDLLHKIMSEINPENNIIDVEYEDLTNVEDDYSENEEKQEEDESLNLD